MVKQEPLFDPEEGERRKGDGIERAGKHADREWKVRAYAAIRDLTRKRQYLTADDVWEWIASHYPEASTRQHSAMGAVFKAAQADELITPTDFFIMSERASTHRRPLRCWRTLCGADWGGPHTTQMAAQAKALKDVDDILDFMYPRLKGQAASYTMKARRIIGALGKKGVGVA